MSGSETSGVTVEGVSSRWSPWWLTSGGLFVVSALLAAFRSLPGSLDVEALVGMSTAATLAFSLALVAAGIGAARRDDTPRLPRGAVVSHFLLAGWLPIGPLLLTASFDFSSAVPIYVNALVELALSGTIVAGVLRSTLVTPWRLIPAIALAAVVLGSLMEFAVMSGGVSDQNAMITVSNVLILTRILATGALAAVALRAARARPGAVVVFGG